MLYVLTNFYGKKILSGSFNKVFDNFYLNSSLPKYCRIYEVVGKGAILIRQHYR